MSITGELQLALKLLRDTLSLKIQKKKDFIMPTHAELASKLLLDAAEFFKTLGDQNPPLADQMSENADVFTQMSQILSQNPTGEISGTPASELAGKLLKDAATFFTTLANQNEPIKDQMLENASVFTQIGDLLMQDPLGELK